jgi:hypothetical protein
LITPLLSLSISLPPLFFLSFSFSATEQLNPTWGISLCRFSIFPFLIWLLNVCVVFRGGNGWGFGYGGLYKEKKTESNQENDTETNFPLSNKQKRQITKRNASIG